VKRGPGAPPPLGRGGESDELAEKKKRKKEKKPGAIMEACCMHLKEGWFRLLSSIQKKAGTKSPPHGREEDYFFFPIAWIILGRAR